MTQVLDILESAQVMQPELAAIPPLMDDWSSQSTWWHQCLRKIYLSKGETPSINGLERKSEGIQGSGRSPAVGASVKTCGDDPGNCKGRAHWEVIGKKN